MAKFYLQNEFQLHQSADLLYYCVADTHSVDIINTWKFYAMISPTLIKIQQYHTFDENTYKPKQQPEILQTHSYPPPYYSSLST